MIKLRNENLANYSSFKIGGPATVLFPEKKSELSELIATLNAKNEPYKVFGNCSNVLFPDEGVPFSVIITTKMREVFVTGRKLRAECGASLNSVATAAKEAGLTGLEFTYGIPGTIGGGLFMNAGAYGGQLSDRVLSCMAVNTKGETVTLTKEEMKLGYRESIFQSGELFVTDVCFELEQGNKHDIAKQMTEFMDRRKACQPLEYPSAGSVFKRPPGGFAGAMIEQCGLKGLSVGGACVSPKHAGFIINTGGATAKDVCELIGLIQEAVLLKFGVHLEPEVRIL